MYFRCRALSHISAALMAVSSAEKTESVGLSLIGNDLFSGMMTKAAPVSCVVGFLLPSVYRWVFPACFSLIKVKLFFLASSVFISCFGPNISVSSWEGGSSFKFHFDL